MPANQWIIDARNELRSLREPEQGWPYRKGNAAATEPTALGALALLATSRLTPPDNSFAAELSEILEWFQATRNNDGSYSVRPGMSAPKWTTTQVLLVHMVVEQLHPTESEYGQHIAASVAWLLRRVGRRIPKNTIVGHDGMIPGWPWIEDTHSWVEPTAWALIALQKFNGDGPGLRERISLGHRLLRNRMLLRGGWNYGNTKMLGMELRPRIAPTGLALLAMSGEGSSGAFEDGRQDEPKSSLIRKQLSDFVQPSLSYLERELTSVRSPQSLCWGLLGLATFDRLPEYAETALAEAYARTTGRPDAAIQLSYLLLAANNCGLDLLRPTNTPTSARVLESAAQ